MSEGKKNEEIRLNKQRLCKKRRYNDIKNDPELLALEKEKRRATYIKRKEKKSVTSIADKTPRAQREQRKKWKENSKRYRQRKKENEKKECILQAIHIEAQSNDTDKENNLLEIEDPLHRNCLAARKAVRKVRYAAQKHRKHLMRIIDVLKKKNASQQKCIYLLKKKLQEANLAVKDDVNLKELEPNTSVVRQVSTVSQARKNKIDTIISFYTDDKNSTIGAGKKEYITRNKKRMQKRYLTAHLTDLYKQFRSETNIRVSYSWFCKLRPFWVLYPKAHCRETCQCTIHLNIELLIKSLNKASIVKQRNSAEVLATLCCDSRNTNCLQRKCDACSSKCLDNNEFSNDRDLTFFEWARVQKKIELKDSKKKMVVVTVKQKVTMKPIEALSKLQSDLKKILSHMYRIVHQYNAIKHLKQNPNIREALVHVDFSENYCLKFAEEVQSMHFGASRQQISIHTAVIYTHNFSTGSVCPTSFCSISKCLRHDAPAIWAHLEPLIAEINKLNPFVDTIHFLSDSPSSQYRNKNMFYVISQLGLGQISKITWNYSEAGHGKGAPDGVGATLKRTADRMVNFGSDVGSYEEFYELVSTKIENILIKKVEEKDILDKDNLIPQTLKAFKGTFSVYQVLYDKFTPRTALRKMSCFMCDTNELCVHGHHIGSIINIPVTRKENMDPEVVLLASTNTKRSNRKIRIISNVLLNVTNVDQPSTSKATN